MSAHRGRRVSSPCTSRHAWELPSSAGAQKEHHGVLQRSLQRRFPNTQLAPHRVSLVQNGGCSVRARGPSSPARPHQPARRQLWLRTSSLQSLRAC